MDSLNRIWAYYLATPIDNVALEDIAGGWSGMIPSTIHLTGDPLAPDVSKDD